jgi:predicted Rossmann fold flavoprotein
VLQISSYWQPGEAVSIDLLPGQDAFDLLRSWKSEHPRTLLRTQLGTVLPRQLVLELEKLYWPDAGERLLADWPDRQLKALAGQLQAWEVKPAGTEGYRTAEVTLGGVDTRDLSSRTMESATTPGLFFIGEVVDVTGHLGGFNFQWAWSSGYAAGLAV